MTGPLQAGRSARVRARVGVVSATIGLLFFLGMSEAFAVGSSTDLTAGAGDTFFTKITSYFTGHVITAVLALFALTIGVAMLMGWGRKSAKSK